MRRMPGCQLFPNTSQDWSHGHIIPREGTTVDSMSQKHHQGASVHCTTRIPSLWTPSRPQVRPLQLHLSPNCIPLGLASCCMPD